MLPWKKKQVPNTLEDARPLFTVLSGYVEGLKHLILAPKEDKSIRFADEIEGLCAQAARIETDDSALQAALKIKLATESFADHQRSSIEKIIAELDHSLRDMVSTLDQALTSGDKMLDGVSSSSRKLGLLQEIRTYEELRKKVAEEVAFLNRAVSEYRQTTHAIQERYRKELDAMRSNLDVAQLAAKVDTLTNLPNRACHEYQLVGSLERVCQGAKYALAIIDMDGFKAINDTHGHMAGDNALVVFTEALCKHLGGGIFVARLGGDEFTVIAEGSKEALDKRLRDFETKLASTRFDIGVTKQYLAMSFGVVDVLAGSSYRTLMKEVDDFMYASKKAKKQARSA